MILRNPSTSPLLTDLYQLTMLQSYLEKGMHDVAVFEFFVRRLPENRGFLLFSGLETLLTFIEGMRFTEDDREYLAATARFTPRLIEYLKSFRFSGDIEALPEGTVFFETEPVVRVTAPIPEAQLLETRLINILHFETMIASKAVRCVLAAGGKSSLVDFGLRRAHGAEAGLLAARASYIAGFTGTSTVLAEAVYGIPIFGTMAHSFVEAYEREEDAFVDFARTNPDNALSLIDTYDTLRGAEKAAEVAKTLAREAIRVRAVRLDSGDLLTLSKDVRRILDEKGFREIRIFVSGNIDEHAIRTLLTHGAPIDGFGVGTKLDTSADAPYMDSAYKLMEYAGRPRCKTSEGKATLPGRKQVFRHFEKGAMKKDILTLEGDTSREGFPLLEKVVAGGCRLIPQRDLKTIASHAREEISSLPKHLRNLETAPPYPVEISLALNRLQMITKCL